MRLRLPQKFGLATKFNTLIVASILATTLGMGALIVREEIADAFASVTAEAFGLPKSDVPAPQGERLVAIMNDWLATRNWRFAYVRDPQTFAWPGSWIALVTDERSPSGWRPVLMFGDPSGPLRDAVIAQLQALADELHALAGT